MKCSLEIYQAKVGKGKGKWRARVWSENGRILVSTPEGYVNRKDLLKTLRLVGRLLK